MAAATATDVQKAYLAYFGRPADPVGLAYWTGKDTAVMKAGFAASVEYATLYAGMTSAQMVSQVYTNLLGRTADVAGLLYWSGELAAGRQTVSSLVDSMQANALGADVTTINNRVTYATAFTAALDTAAEIVAYNGTAAANSARTAIASVVDTEASLTAATAALDATISTVTTTGTSSAGTTSTLTTSIDVVTGTSGNDTIIGDSATTSTADQITAGAGADTLKLYDTVVLPTMSGIETLYLNSPGASLDVSAKSEITALEIDNETLAGAAYTYTVAATQSVALKSITGHATNDLNIATAAATTSQTVSVNAVGSSTTDANVDITGTGVTSLNLSSSGTASYVELANAGGALATLTVTGDKAVTIDAQTDNTSVLTAISASGMTAGGLSITLEDGTGGTAKNVTFTGGAGDDAVFFGASFDANDTADGGTGTNTVGIADGGDLTLTSGAKLTNFTVLDIRGAVASTYDMDNLAGITKIKLGAAAAGAATIVDAAVGTTLEIASAITGGTLTFNQKGAGAGSADDTQTVTFNAATAITTGAALDINDIETVTVNSTSTGTAITHTASTLTADEALTINVNASTAALTISAMNAANLVSFDASTSAKAVSLTTTDTFNAAGGIAVKGGAGDDVFDLDAATVTGAKIYFTGGAGADTMKGLAGGNVDTFIYTSATDSTVAKTDAIGTSGGVEFDTTEDKIDVSSFAFNATQKAALLDATAVAGTAALTASVADFFNSAGTDRGVAIVDDGTDTYVYVDANKNGDFDISGDLAIKLVGVTGAEVPVIGDFVFV